MTERIRTLEHKRPAKRFRQTMGGSSITGIARQLTLHRTGGDNFFFRQKTIKEAIRNYLLKKKRCSRENISNGGRCPRRDSNSCVSAWRSGSSFLPKNASSCRSAFSNGKSSLRKTGNEPGKSFENGTRCLQRKKSKSSENFAGQDPKAVHRVFTPKTFDSG